MLISGQRVPVEHLQRGICCPVTSVAAFSGAFAVAVMWVLDGGSWVGDIVDDIAPVRLGDVDVGDLGFTAAGVCVIGGLAVRSMTSACLVLGMAVMWVLDGGSWVLDIVDDVAAQNLHQNSSGKVGCKSKLDEPHTLLCLLSRHVTRGSLFPHRSPVLCDVSPLLPETPALKLPFQMMERLGR